METLDREPTVIDAGTTVAWNRNLSEFRAPDFGLAYRIINQANVFQADATGNDDGTFSVLITADESAAFVAGSYELIGTVVGNVVEHVYRAPLEIRANVLTGAPVDTRSQDELILEAIRAAIQSSATSNQLRLSVGGRSLERHSLSELHKLEARYADRVARAKRLLPQTVGVTFASRFRRPY